MRNWCVAVAVSALLALPLCAQQNGDGASAAAATAEKSPAKAGTGDIVPASRNLFALPESPRPKPLPGGKSSSDTPPGRIVPRFEFAGMFQYINFNPGGGFSSFNNYGGTGSFTWNATSWLGITEEIGATEFHRQVVNVGSSSGNLTTFMVGPRVNFRKFDYFVPYIEFMMGAGHSGFGMTGNNSQNAFTMVAGGGVDVVLTKHIVWRFAEIDYL